MYNSRTAVEAQSVWKHAFLSSEVHNAGDPHVVLYKCSVKPEVERAVFISLWKTLEEKLQQCTERSIRE